MKTPTKMPTDTCSNQQSSREPARISAPGQKLDIRCRGCDAISDQMTIASSLNYCDSCLNKELEDFSRIRLHSCERKMKAEIN